jgi:hypothetical protein
LPSSLAIQASDSLSSCSPRQILHVSFIEYPVGTSLNSSTEKRNPLSNASPVSGIGTSKRRGRCSPFRSHKRVTHSRAVFAPSKFHELSMTNRPRLTQGVNVGSAGNAAMLGRNRRRHYLNPPRWAPAATRSKAGPYDVSVSARVLPPANRGEVPLSRNNL